MQSKLTQEASEAAARHARREAGSRQQSWIYGEAGVS
jgi:hypothetical protein